ncbi:MAG: RraA family protein [Alphaproteobacteria bacterium]
MLDADRIALVRSGLYAAVLSDTLDSLGYREQAMHPSLRPLDDSLVLFGRARTGLYMEVYGETPGENPYELEIALIDDLKPDDVAVLACPRGDRVAPWGELLSTASVARKAAGCVTDGLVRDVRMIRSMRFPVFAGGIGPLDSKGRGTVMRIDVPVRCGGVLVNPGDWVFGDVDGVVVIPDAVAEQATALALEKVSQENSLRDELAAGVSLKDAFARYGIL